MRSNPPEVFELGAIKAALATAGLGLREASITPKQGQGKPGRGDGERFWMP